MKKYEYKVTYLKQVENPEEKLNNYGEDGWRVLDVSWTDGGNLLSVFMEREHDTRTELEVEKAIGEIKNKKYSL